MAAKEMIDLTKGAQLKDGETYIYHVSGDGAYFGTAKFHLFEDCRHLVNWIPAGHRVLRKSGWKEGKIITRDSRKILDTDTWNFCKTCLKRRL